MAQDLSPAVTPDPNPASARLGFRFEFYEEGSITGAVSREDALGAGVPRPGEFLARGCLSTLMHDLVGLDAEIHHVDHYVVVPGSRETTPLATAVVQINRSFADVVPHVDQLKGEGWYVHDLRHVDRRLR